MADLVAVKMASRARESEEKRLAERRRCALVLILRHLADCGYVDSYERLSNECNLHLNKVDVADNIDLLTVVQEFELSYELKYGRRAKLIKRTADDSMAAGAPRGYAPPQPASAGAHASGSTGPSGRPHTRLHGIDGPPVSGALAARQRREAGLRTADDDRRASPTVPSRKQTPPADAAEQHADGGPVGMDDLAIQGVAPAAGGSPARANADGAHDADEDPEQRFQNRVLKPLPINLQGELRELGQAITRDIFNENPNVRWGDISGLEEAKHLLKEAVVQPIKYPELFTGLLAPWKGVLLYGPPGTGKTMLAKAVATECRTTFFNIQASSIISKWRGDSEKLVRVLFELARHHSPSTIFLDEIDALMGARGGEGEHEASRRMKTEILVQMDGLTRSSQMVFVLAATNLPWELDQAMLRRLEKRIHVPLPDMGARLRMLDGLLSQRVDGSVSLESLAERTDGYSGSDVWLVAKEAAMRPLRRLMCQLEAAENLGSDAQKLGKAGVHDSGVAAERPAAAIQLGQIQVADINAALSVTKASARRYEAEYVKFSDEYGQLGA